MSGIIEYATTSHHGYYLGFACSPQVCFELFFIRKYFLVDGSSRKLRTNTMVTAIYVGRESSFFTAMEKEVRLLIFQYMPQQDIIGLSVCAKQLAIG